MEGNSHDQWTIVTDEMIKRGSDYFLDFFVRKRLTLNARKSVYATAS